MPQDKGDVFSGAPIGDPIPGEYALDADDPIGAIGGNSLEEGLGIAFHVAMEQDVADLIEDAQIQGPGVQIDAAVVGMLLRVEAHEVSSLLGVIDWGSSKYTPGRRRP